MEGMQTRGETVTKETGVQTLYRKKGEVQSEKSWDGKKRMTD